MCLPKMLTYIHAQIEKDTQGPREICPDPFPAIAMVTSGTHTWTDTEIHTYLKKTQKDLHPVSHRNDPPKPQCTQKKPQRKPHVPHSPGWMRTKTQGHHTHTQSHSFPVLTPQVLPTGGSPWHSPWAGLSRHRWRHGPSSPGTAA